MIVQVEWYGIKLQILGNHYADGDYEIEDMIVCDDKWISREELPAHMITETAEREIYSLVGKALDEVEGYVGDAVDSCVCLVSYE